jgi:[ribosomal protein S5]-alanine N-acetyltransferase
MHAALPNCVVRHYRGTDAPSLARQANDRRIWRNLRDRFPHPYGLGDAESFIAMATTMSPVTFFAIAIDDQVVGGIGYTLHEDVERVSAEVGYWLGTEFWGRGVMTSALDAVTRYAFAQHEDLRRLYAVPFAWSAASVQVLEKVGYRLEGRMRQSAVKDGQVTDQLLYAIVREELPAKRPIAGPGPIVVQPDS